MGKIVLTFLGVGICIGSAFAQVSGQVSSPEYADSLNGFDPTRVQLHCGVTHDSATEAMEMREAERRYIDYKYKLGIYSPDYQYPGTVSANPVFPVAACANVDFETGDFTGWAGAIGDNDQSNQGPLSNQQAGIFSTVQNALISDPNARHTIMTPAGGNDPYGGFPVVPAGAGNYTVRMGGETPNYQAEILEQTFTVSPTSTSFAYRYAVVLNDPQSGHTATAKPFFKIEVLDQFGQPISVCTQYFVIADTGVAGFQLSSLAPPTGGVAYYKPWTLLNFDLTAYVNQNITIRFSVGGCTQSGHFGYCYIDASCSALAASINFCPGNTFLYLGAPPGYGAYQWLDPNHVAIPGATNDTLLVNNPVVGDTFFVYLTASNDTSCHNTLPVVLEYTHIFPNAMSTDETCYNYDDGTMTSAGTAGFAPYTYSWNTSPPTTTQSVTGVSPGTYVVHMIDSLGCEAYDTVVIAPAVRLDTSLFVYTFCPGDDHVTLTAPFGFQSYTWIGPTGDTLPTPSPANVMYIVGPQVNEEYNVILYSPPGCPIYDSIVLNLNPPASFFVPDTLVNVFTPNGDQKNDFFYPYYDYTVASQTAANAQPAYEFFDLYIATYEIWVYDRWGREMFYSNDYKYGWDGMFDKKEAVDGVYYWVAVYTSRCDETYTPITKNGFVHLKR